MICCGNLYDSIDNGRKGQSDWPTLRRIETRVAHRRSRDY